MSPLPAPFPLASLPRIASHSPLAHLAKAMGLLVDHSDSVWHSWLALRHPGPGEEQTPEQDWASIGKNG